MCLQTTARFQNVGMQIVNPHGNMQACLTAGTRNVKMFGHAQNGSMNSDKEVLLFFDLNEI